MIIQVIAACLAIAAFGVVIEAPRRYLVFCGMIGGIGWAVYLLCEGSQGTIMATFYSALVIAVLSHIWARIFKAPVTVFLISGILVLVPGANLYRTVYEVFLGSTAMASHYLMLTVQMAGMIALAIFVVDSFFNLIREVPRIHRKKNGKILKGNGPWKR